MTDKIDISILERIDKLDVKMTSKFDSLDVKFASLKRVELLEKIVYGACGLILVAFLTSVIKFFLTNDLEQAVNTYKEILQITPVMKSVGLTLVAK